MKIKEFYTDQSKWVQDYFAISHTGQNIEDIDVVKNTRLVEIKSLCLFAAIKKFYPNVDDFRATEKKVKDLLRIDDKRTISEWNSAKDRTFEEVQYLVEYLNI